MYQLIVVDDETAIRKGMCNYIDWQEMGYNVAADFEDGKEAVEYIKKHHVDVVLTDIQMAEVTGLDLAGYICANDLPVKVVIISGYKEFEYARKAVEYNVNHYLLKPIRLPEVQEVFLKIRQELDRMREVKERDLDLLLPELREQFWVSMLIGGIRSKDSILKKRDLLGFEFSLDTPCAILDINLTIEEDSDQKYYNQGESKFNLLSNIFEGSLFNISYYPAYLASNIIKVIAISAEVTENRVFRENLRQDIRAKTESVQKLLTLCMDVSIEKISDDIMKLVEYKYTLQMNVEIKEKSIGLIAEDYERLIQKYKLLIGIIGDGDFEELDNLVENIFFEFRKLPIEQVKQLVIDMFSMLSNKLLKMDSHLWMDLNVRLNYQDILQIESRELLKSTCKNQLTGIIELISRRQSNVSRTVVDQSVSYMKKHYGEDLSLESMAEKYFLNPTYFGRLFKQYTGSTFTDYLIELRMEKAKELICTGKYKMYEVSRMVGYRSDKYFFRVFKQYTQKAPLEYYRNQVLKDEE